MALTHRAPADPTPVISHLALSLHPTSWLSDVMYLLTAAFPQVPGAAARWRARRRDVTTLPALNDYHERPRCASTTRRQLAAEPACSRRVTVPTKPGEDGCVRDRSGRLRQGGKVSMGLAGFIRSSWRITLGLTPRRPHATPPAAHQLGRADKHETVTREGIGITFL